MLGVEYSIEILKYGLSLLRKPSGGLGMAKVLVSMKIYPSDIDLDLESLKEDVRRVLPSYASVYRFEEEPIAFGLKALIAHILLPEDKSGGIEDVESSLQGLEGISQLETLMVRRTRL